MASTGDFVHLHLHTEYSFLDGMNKIERVLERAGEFGMPAVAVTDNGNLCGAVEFYKKAKDYEIKPILGMEVMLAPSGSRHDRDPRNKRPHRLILIAKDRGGYNNLARLSTIGYMEGLYFGRPLIDKDVLRMHTEGLFASSACLMGEIATLLMDGNIDAARDAARTYQAMFEPGHFHLEIQETGIPAQRAVNDRLCELSRDLDIPLLATANCHYLDPEDALAHRVLRYIGWRKKLEEGERPDADFHFKSGELVAEQFSYAPEAIERTLWIAEQCEFDFDLGTYHMPRFDPPENLELGEFFAAEARKGLAERLIEARERGWAIDGGLEKQYVERLEYEIGVIKEMGFPGYFLIVADFIKWAKSKDIPVGPGRGSAAGSLVAYAMRITEVDPIPFGLVFERFLNPGRNSMPDIDVDFCMDRRGEVIDYITDKYGGRENVTQIITYSKMKAKAVIRDVARVLGMPFTDADRIAKLIPDRDPESKNPLHVTLKRAMEMEPRLTQATREDPRIGQLLDLAQRLEGLNRQAGMHAAGVVIGDEAFAEGMPLYKTPDEDVVTQFDMNGVETLGFIKFDFLGLKTLTMIRHAEELVRQRHDSTFDIEKIPMDDPRVFERLSAGDNIGIFQLESGGMRDTMLRLKPTNIEEISDILALYRPGPMDNIPDFADRKFGRRPVTYLLPALKPILGPTQGIIVYQEQIIRMASDLAGYTLSEADMLRRAVGKKKADEMERQRAKFIDGAVDRGHDRKAVEELWSLILEFANYGFNKSHSVAYALITYQTAYLKTHYPHEFMAALLTSEMNDSDKMLKNLNECRSMGIEVLPPDVNESERAFSVVGNKIRFGLEAIKGVGSSTIDAIVEARGKLSSGQFADLYEFCESTDLRRVNRKVLEALIKAGAFDSLGGHRAQLFAASGSAFDAGQAAQRDRNVGQHSMFGAFDAASDGDSVVKTLPEVEPWSQEELLQYERACLGFYVTDHPLTSFAQTLHPYTTHTTVSVREERDGVEVRIGVILSSLTERRNKKGDLFAKIKVEDQLGFLDVFVSAALYEQYQGVLAGAEPMVLCGTVSRDPVTRDVEVRAKEFIPLSAAREKLSERLDIRINTALFAQDQVERLKQVLARARGRVPATLYLMLPDGEREVVCELAEKVSPTAELLAELRALSEGIQVLGP